jgi:hypothetical protein
MKEIKYVTNPLKSTALALLFAIIFGPLGVLYSTVIGAFILVILFLVCWGAKSMHALTLIWLAGCFCAVIMTRVHNARWLKKCGGSSGGCHHQKTSV